jgi:hypothetical protein
MNTTTRNVNIHLTRNVNIHLESPINAKQHLDNCIDALIDQPYIIALTPNNWHTIFSLLSDEQRQFLRDNKIGATDLKITE